MLTPAQIKAQLEEKRRAQQRAEEEMLEMEAALAQAEEDERKRAEERRRVEEERRAEEERKKAEEKKKAEEEFQRRAGELSKHRVMMSMQAQAEERRKDKEAREARGTSEYPKPGPPCWRCQVGEIECVRR
jgi:hypothetical protein